MRVFVRNFLFIFESGELQIFDNSRLQRSKQIRLTTTDSYYWFVINDKKYNQPDKK